MIKKVKVFVEIVFEKAQLDLRFSQWIAYLIGLSFFLNPGNACPANLETGRGERSGPIPIVNQTPIQLLFLQAVPDNAETLPKDRYSLSLNTTTTNTLLWEESEDYSGHIDMEMIRTSLELQYGILPWVEIGISLPFVYSYPGFMDNTILDIEESFVDKTRDLREKEETGRYTYNVKKDNKPFISGRKRSSAIGDLALRVKGKIWDEQTMLPSLSARVAFKVPTGDKDRALGSGEPDWGFGLLLQKGIKKSTAYLNADVIFPGDAFEDENVPLAEFYEMMLGVEYEITSQMSILAQVNYRTRPFRNTGLQMLDRRIYDFLLGINYLTQGGVFIQGGGIEDFNGSEDAGADITFFLNVGKRF